MISTESRMISGLRRSITPSAPVAKSSALRITYQLTSGPCIALRRARVRAEDDTADRRDEQHDRRDLEREEVVGEEGAAERLRRAELAADLRRLGQEPAGGEADYDDHLGEN